MNKDWFNEIYNQYHREVFKVIFTLVKKHQDAEDLTQDIFFTLYLHGLKNFKEPSQIKYWLIVTAKHKTLNYLKRNRRIIPTSTGFLTR